MKTLNDFVAENPELFRQEELILETTELIARVMEQNSITKTELARRLKKTKAFVSQCLNGEQNLTLRTLADLLGALGYKMQVGAAPLSADGKSIHRLFPIGGWSFEQSCGTEEMVCDFAAVETSEEIEDEVFPEAA